MILSCLAVSCCAKITVPVLVIANSYSLFPSTNSVRLQFLLKKTLFNKFIFKSPPCIRISGTGTFINGTMAIAICFFFGCLPIRNFNFFSQQIVVHLFHAKVRNLGNNNETTKGFQRRFLLIINMKRRSCEVSLYPAA